MNTVERAQNVFDKAIAGYDQTAKAIQQHLDGPPPGGRTLPAGPLHRQWFMQQLADAEKQYPPQWWITKDGPRFASLWLINRQFVKGWDAELTKFERESGLR